MTSPTGLEPILSWLTATRFYQLNYGENIEKCPKVESNHRHKDFQSYALPTELSGQIFEEDGT